MKKKSRFNIKRREALKKSMQGALATGAVVSVKEWKQPAIKAIVLPAHAATNQNQTKTISITNITVSEAVAGGVFTQVFSANNPVCGSNLGAFNTEFGDNGEMNASGVILPPPPDGTNLQVSANTANDVDSTNTNCFFLNPDPCVVDIPVNSTNGDFTLS